MTTHENPVSIQSSPNDNRLVVLSQAQLDALDIDLNAVLNVVESAFIGLRQGSQNPQKTIIQPEKQQSISYSMVGRDSASQTIGFKVVYEFDPYRQFNNYNFLSFIFLCDDQTGRPIALMDVVKLGPLRTAATSALMARATCPNAKTALIVGTGIQGQMALPLLLTALPQLEKLQIFGHYQDGIIAAQKTLKHYFPEREIEVVTSLEQAANQADIIIGVAGAAAQHQVKYQWMKVGSIAILVGYGVDADVFQKADRVITTDIEQMKVTCGDLLNEDGQLPHIHAELPDILNGTHTAKLNPNEIVFAYNSGMVVTDIALGRYLADQALQQSNQGQTVNLW